MHIFRRVGAVAPKTERAGREKAPRFIINNVVNGRGDHEHWTIRPDFTG